MNISHLELTKEMVLCTPEQGHHQTTYELYKTFKNEMLQTNKQLIFLQFFISIYIPDISNAKKKDSPRKCLCTFSGKQYL